MLFHLGQRHFGANHFLALYGNGASVPVPVRSPADGGPTRWATGRVETHYFYPPKKAEPKPETPPTVVRKVSRKVVKNAVARTHGEWLLGPALAVVPATLPVATGAPLIEAVLSYLAAMPKPARIIPVVRDDDEAEIEMLLLAA